MRYITKVRVKYYYSYIANSAKDGGAEFGGVLIESRRAHRKERSELPPGIRKNLPITASRGKRTHDLLVRVLHCGFRSTTPDRSATESVHSKVLESSNFVIAALMLEECIRCTTQFLFISRLPGYTWVRVRVLRVLIAALHEQDLIIGNGSYWNLKTALSPAKEYKQTERKEKTNSGKHWLD